MNCCPRFASRPDYPIFGYLLFSIAGSLRVNLNPPKLFHVRLFQEDSSLIFHTEARRSLSLIV